MNPPLTVFASKHSPALEKDAVRHNLLLGVLARSVANNTSLHCFWDLGEPGQCAIQTAPEWPVLLGQLSEAQCATFAESLVGQNISGVIGPDTTAISFADAMGRKADVLGFRERMRTLALVGAPMYPKAQGHHREPQESDADLVFKWLVAFRNEAVPHDPLPEREKAKEAIASGNFLLWEINGQPVSMAVMTRKIGKLATAIGGVYTPPEHRGRGYAGSVVASISDKVLANGTERVCLFTDASNPISNRCYEKIGFQFHNDAWKCSRR